MGALQTLAGILGISVVSGVNLYAAVLTIGLAIRYEWVEGVPEQLAVLAHPAVLIAAGALYLIEFVADKIPFVTPLWDAIHTLIRPLGAVLLALAASADLSAPVQALAVLAAGSVSLGAHSTKMGMRLLAHGAPEPVSHSIISILEDFGVVGLLVLVYMYPGIALAVLIALLVVIAVLLTVVFRALRMLWSKLFRRIRSGERRDAVERT